MKYVVGTQSHSFKREGCTSHHIPRFLLPTGLTEEASYLGRDWLLALPKLLQDKSSWSHPPHTHFKLAFTALRTLKYWHSMDSISISSKIKWEQSKADMVSATLVPPSWWFYCVPVSSWRLHLCCFQNADLLLHVWQSPQPRMAERVDVNVPTLLLLSGEIRRDVCYTILRLSSSHQLW